ncbi:hypothetical protein AAGS61_07910 [Lysinibacillus sp. KU-BSD001]|uniref:hypothetical protein n=1 Tax=Lysinibacillus sp. KU-BSD001 TaxID=3141328 RepID=UPI0036E2AB2F
MLKDEFDKEPSLQKRLDEYKVEVPQSLAQFKVSRWQRFIEFLASPAKDPLEQIHSSSSGYNAMKLVPLASAVLITILQLFIL